MRRFILRLLLFILPLAALTVLSFFVDPIDLYAGPQWSDPWYNHYRAAKVHDLLYETDFDYDAYLLGSSRMMVMPVEPVNELGYKTYNFSYNLTRAEDIYLNLRFLLDHNERPIELIVLGLDVMLFHDSLPFHRQGQRVPELARYRIDELRLPDERFSELETLTIGLQTTAEALFDELIGTEPTGGFTFETRTGVRTDDTDRRFVIDAHTLEIWHGIYSGFEELEPRRLAYFDRFIELAAENDIRILAFLTTNHAILDDHLRRVTDYAARLTEAREYWDSIDYPGFTWVDLSRVESFNEDPDGFFDLGHVNPENAELCLEYLLESHY